MYKNSYKNLKKNAKKNILKRGSKEYFNMNDVCNVFLFNFLFYKDKTLNK